MSIEHFVGYFCCGGLAFIGGLGMFLFNRACKKAEGENRLYEEAMAVHRNIALAKQEQEWEEETKAHRLSEIKAGARKRIVLYY